MSTKTFDPKDISGAIRFFTAGPTGKQQDNFEVMRLTPHPEYDVILYPDTSNATPIHAVIKTALKHLQQGDSLQAKLLLRETADALQQVQDLCTKQKFTGVVPESQIELAKEPERGAPKIVHVDLSHDTGKVDSVEVTHVGGVTFNVNVTGPDILPFSMGLSVGNAETVSVVPIISESKTYTLGLGPLPRNFDFED